MSALARELKSVRQFRKLSLAAVAQPAKISAAYLQKLENGTVQNPSPRVLMRLAKVLDCSYNYLMELAGYLVDEEQPDLRKSSFLEAALQQEELSDEEQRAVLAFISYLKDNRKR